jgi:poly-gamma-glutamate synthesis protein (capsule biosynthesis protein)
MSTNRDPSKMTVVVMTGVSALVRATAERMDTLGFDYPGREISHWLLDADFTHVSHEVSFTEDCPPPDPYQVNLRFCSDPNHVDLFEGLDIDIIELTGNHLLDWGSEAFQETLNLYSERDIQFYAGGYDLEMSLIPLLLEHNGNRFAFLGCNSPGPEEVWARDGYAGAAPCVYESLEQDLRSLRMDGILPIFTFQWAEAKRPQPLPLQVEAFRRIIDAGAVIVSGSQAHRPQSMEFYQSSFIHYGLGNLFFDQMQTLENRQEFIDRHIFYEGRHISTELLTALLEDYAQPRPMTASDRQSFLEEMFAASGW